MAISHSFSAEAELVEHLAELINGGEHGFATTHLLSEFDYKGGKADLVAISPDSEVYVFEAKITKWRKALEQAYRSSSYAHFVCVVLPARAAALASKRIDEFERRGVGLLQIQRGHLQTILAPKRSEPLLPWLTNTARENARYGIVSE
ncbi:MAG: hypothetical protein JSR82_17165 [Verrucomicrobia bacterium]|nr:hypothetical protein [Verrucomicrobiota bacterium]